MERWEKNLKHERDVRDALVACGNPKPTEPDPDGGVIRVPVRIFKGRIFWLLMKDRGHDNSDFNSCMCRTTS